MKQIEKREIALCIILSLITCGIYLLVWMAKITNDVAKVSGDENFTGGKAVLFAIITCGIYTIWWGYHVGELIKKTKIELGLETEDYPTIYLVLLLCSGFTSCITGFVMYALAQSELNNIADKVYVG